MGMTRATTEEPEDELETRLKRASENKADPLEQALMKAEKAQRKPPEKTVFQSQLEGASGFLGNIGQNIPIAGALVEKAGRGIAAGLKAPFSDESFTELYDKFEKRDESDKAKFADEHPGWAIGSAVAGGALLPGLGVSKAAKAGATILQKAGVAAENLTKEVVENVGIAYTDALARGESGMEAIKSSLIGTGIVKGAVAGVKGAKDFTRRAVFGVPKETAETYAARRSEIKGVDEETLKDDIDKAIGRVSEMGTGAKKGLDESKLNEAMAFRDLKQTLKETKPRESLDTEIIDEIKGLRSDVSKASGAAIDGLQAAGRKISTANLRKLGEGLRDELTIGGKPPIAGVAKQDYDTFDLWLQQLDELSGARSHAEPKDVKRYIQLIDEQISSAYDRMKRGEYVGRGERKLEDLRGKVDGYLKERFPDYAKAMLPVAQKTKIVNEANKFFREQGKIHGTLKGINKPENIRQREALTALSKERGKDFTGDIGDYERAQKSLASPQELERLRSAMPEAENLRGARQDLDDANLWSEPMRGITSQSSQQAISNISNRKKPNLEKQRGLEYLGQVEGKDFVQQAKDLGIKQAMERGFSQGSRNVNLGALSLAAFTGAMGKLFGAMPGGDISRGVGAMAGALADSFPQAYRVMSDMAADPRVQKYVPVLESALRKSPQSFLMYNYMISQKDPNYKQFLENKINSQ